MSRCCPGSRERLEWQDVPEPEPVTLKIHPLQPGNVETVEEPSAALGSSANSAVIPCAALFALAQGIELSVRLVEQLVGAAHRSAFT